MLAAALGLGACLGGGLTTSSILSGVTGVKQPAPPANDPTARALHVASISARATKCGYNFDAGRLREAFLASEARQGLAGAELGKVERSYDYARAAVSKQIASNADYCTSEKAAEIKSGLTKALAGDFNPPMPRVPVAAGPDVSSKVEPMNREAIFNPDLRGSNKSIFGGSN